jgi:hypothetical protein
MDGHWGHKILNENLPKKELFEDAVKYISAEDFDYPTISVL